MRITPEGIFMTAAAYIDRAARWARRLEDTTSASHGVPVTQARTMVARLVGVSAGTLENLRKGRLKAVSVHVYDRLCAGMIRGLEAEMRHLEHELQILRQSGVDPRDSQISEAEADLAKVRRALSLGDRSGA